MPKFHSTTEVYIVVLGENTLPGATKLASQLREEGVNTELDITGRKLDDITGRKLDKQIKTAVKKQIPYMLFVGEEELHKELYSFKDTNTSSEEKLSFARIVSKVKDRRKKSKDELDDFTDL